MQILCGERDGATWRYSGDGDGILAAALEGVFGFDD